MLTFRLFVVHQKCDKMYCDNYQLFAVHQKCDKICCNNYHLTILLSTAHRIIQPIPVNARSKLWVCSRSFVGLQVRIPLGNGRLSFVNVLYC